MVLFVNNCLRRVNTVYCVYVIFLLSLYINTCLTKDHRYNPSNDFLLHEAGGIPFNNNKNNFDANFPSLPSSKPTQSTTTVSTAKPTSSGKRDYVAPQRATTKATVSTKSTKNAFTQATSANSNFPKRDYVAPQFPTLKPIGNSQKQFNSATTPLPSTSPKRDYVAPQIPSANQQNNQHMTGKVKDLINFYDRNGQGGVMPSKKPSYSNILQGPKDNQKPTLPTSNINHGAQSPTSTTVNTPKPMSFSAVVSGSKGQTNSINTPKTPTNSPISRPTPVLPSSITSQIPNTNSNSPSDTELQNISEELLKKDVNNAAKYVTINYQEKTTSFSTDDKAPLPLLTVSPEAWNIPTIQYFVPLLDNYERDTLVNEYVTSQERNEENAFMDAIMATSVIRYLMNFLKDKGYVTPDPKQQRDYLKQMWFGLYSRGKGKISSSGFEHIFVSELKNGEVSGLHNWVYYSKEEVANRINYMGYLKYVEFTGKGAVLKMHFNQQGVDKPVDTMFIGTSPELEMALYTLCYVTRVAKDCKLKLGTKEVDIVTHNFRYRSKNYIGSAYPQI